jgi:ketol-acid reductoisomerase
MNQLNLFPVLPEVSDEAAVALFELLHELALVFESHYAAQIQRHMRQHSPPANAPPEPDWDEHGPPF